MSAINEAHSSLGRRATTYALIVGLAASLGWWVVSLNRISVQTSLPDGSRSVVVELPDPEPLVVTISPARRVEGTEVLIDGQRVAHPPGAEPGQIIITLDRLEPGQHTIEIRVSRPTWISESVEVGVEILPSSTRR